MQVGGTFSAQSVAQGSDDRLLAGMSEKGRGKQSDGMFEEYGKGKQSGGERAMNADSQQAVWFALQEEGASPAQSIAQGSDGRLLTVVKGEKGHNDSFIVADVKGRDIRNMMLLLDHGEPDRPPRELKTYNLLRSNVCSKRLMIATHWTVWGDETGGHIGISAKRL